MGIDWFAFTGRESYPVAGTYIDHCKLKSRQRDHRMKLKLSENQAALILGTSEDGGISVDVAGSDLDGLPGAICQANVEKLMQDDKFQAELMYIVKDQAC